MAFNLDALSVRTMCEEIEVGTDSVVEETENFAVTLSQSNSDPAVSVLPDGSSTATISIRDSTGRQINL